jgi:molybdopterin/thiamine biosynthesis adenylyltransferase
MEDRYSRQKRIKGWNQTLLENAHVAMIGSGPLANFTGTLLSALGVGRLSLYHNEYFEKYTPEEFCYADLLSGDNKIHGLEKSLSQVNPLLEINSYVWNFQRNYFADILGKPTVIVDTTNNPRTEATLFSYAMRTGIPIVNASSGGFQGEISVFRPNGDFKHLTSLDQNIIDKYLPGKLLSNDYSSGMMQDSTVSSVIAALAVDEVRKIVMPLDTISVKDENGNLIEKSLEPTLEGKLIYNALSDRLLYNNFRTQDTLKENYSSFTFKKDVKAAIVGAGSLGNVVGLLLAINGVKDIYIFDDDIVEDVNLNRQILFALYGSDVGRKKSFSLADKLLKINPYINVHPVDGLFHRSKSFNKDNLPDVVFDCVDCYTGMEEADEFGKKYNIPVVSGHTDYKEGQAFFSHPQKGYACLDKRLNVREKADEERNPTSCLMQSNPSVIISNWVIGSLMMDIFRRGFSENGDIKPINNLIKYSSLLSNRISTNIENTICQYKNVVSDKYGKCPHIKSCKYDVENKTVI